MQCGCTAAQVPRAAHATDILATCAATALSLPLIDPLSVIEDSQGL